MGADLIGFLVKGPVHLIPEAPDDVWVDATKLEQYRREQCELLLPKAVARLHEIRLELFEWWKGPNVKDPSDVTWKDPSFIHYAEDHFEEANLWPPPEETWSDPLPQLRSTMYDLICLWENGARDASGRTDPDDKNTRILFAGEMTWGDEPQGYGYSTLNEAQSLGLFDVLGIR